LGFFEENTPADVGAQFYLVTRNVRDLRVGELRFPHISLVTPGTTVEGASMSALIIRLPEEKRTRLKLVAKSRKVSVEPTHLSSSVSPMISTALSSYQGPFGIAGWILLASANERAFAVGQAIAGCDF
jgi:hypothetical protein